MKPNLTGPIASVADGWPQDWNALAARAEDERTRRALRSLRTIARIAEFHRVSPAPGGSGAGRRPGTPAASGGSSPAGLLGSTAEERPALGRWFRFVLSRRLGEGAYGEVYQAYDTQLDRDVALKLLKPGRSSSDSGRRLLDEARMLARVRHPNVASVYGAGDHDGRSGIWMELVRGVNLEELLRSRGPLSACEAALVGLDIGRALAAVHAAGLVHRDVKTSNVMREIGGRIVLTDFGAGGGLCREPRLPFVGTPLYLAPELLAGAEASVSSDLYSLGVVLFRLVSASYPRGAERNGDSREAAAASLRDLRPDLPDAFVAAVEWALAADPDERPQSAGALRAALGIVLGLPTSRRRARKCPRPEPVLDLQA